MLGFAGALRAMRRGLEAQSRHGMSPEEAEPLQAMLDDVFAHYAGRDEHIIAEALASRVDSKWLSYVPRWAKDIAARRRVHLRR